MKNNEQNTEAWHEARLGKVTASVVYKVMDRLKSGAKTKAYWDYVAEIAAERLTGQAVEFFENAAMRWGKEVEPQARAAYEFKSGNRIEDAAFEDHLTIPMAGASPDGKVYDPKTGEQIGLTEFKCPQSNTFVKYIALQGAEEIEPKYLHQMHWQMACDPFAKFNDYCVFDPRVKDYAQQIWIHRIERDEKIIMDMEEKVREFQTDVDETLAKLLEATTGQKAEAA